MNSAAWLLEHLSDRDVAFVVHALVTRRSDHEHICELLRDKPDLIEIMLDDPQLYARIMDDVAAAGHVSPHLLFSVLVRQVRRDLQGAAHTMDYAPQGRVPVYDVGELRALLDDAARRDYLVDLLASFTRTSPETAGGTAGRADGRPPAEAAWAGAERSYRWRFSELDLAALERLRSLVDERDRFAVERRIGDLALFLAGTCAHEENRRVFLEAAQQAKVGTASSTLPELLEAFEGKARDAYQNAARHPIARATRVDATLASLADSVRPARKILNHLSERHLDPLREAWFQAPLLEAGR